MENKIMTESALRAFMHDVGLPETMDVHFIFDPIVQVWDVYIIDKKSGVEIHEQTPTIDREFKEKIAGTILHLQEGIAYE